VRADLMLLAAGVALAVDLLRPRREKTVVHLATLSPSTRLTGSVPIAPTTPTWHVAANTGTMFLNRAGIVGGPIR
jgi:hypothetical protein